MLISCCQSLSSLFLKAIVDGASTTCWGSWFQSLTILWLKNIRRIRLVFLAWDSFRLCRLRSWPVSANWKNWVGLMFSFLVIVLYVSIRSPLRHPFSSVVSFRTQSLFIWLLSQSSYQFCSSPLDSFETLDIFLQVRRRGGRRRPLSPATNIENLSLGRPRKRQTDVSFQFALAEFF